MPLGPVSFNCYPNLCLNITDPNIQHALILDVQTKGCELMDHSRNLTILYRVCHKVLNSSFSKDGGLNPKC